ncbi:MAG TPA: hypothetical protein VGD61_27395 [Pyrinomonadaceae bacterium]
MKPQTSRTPEINFNPAQQVTPVIVKIGGGDTTADGTGTGTMIVNIDSYMPFSDITGTTWHEALSTMSGRIHELTLNDGTLNPIYCPVSPQPDVLTSLELTFAEQQQLKVSEVIDNSNGMYLLKVECSGFTFNVTEKAPGEGDWFNSRSPALSDPQSLVFKQKTSDVDTFKFEYAFNNPKRVRFNLDFHADRIQ